ncbi:MAG: aromatic amino acid lyase, partial [Chloroflexi bacterium]|nr:aromatic amino acid lyase [Chloroflexota bacterium]
MKQITIDGQSLTIASVIEVAHDPATQVLLSHEAVERINKASEVVANFIETGQIAYGITTGFGAFKDRLIPLEDVEQLQENIILSHAVGVGDALDE